MTELRAGDVCDICNQLQDIVTSFSKFAASQYDRPLPGAAAKLVILQTPDMETEKHQVRRCPLCGTLYDYQFTHEYMINGTEDEETLSRMTSAQSSDFFLNQARLLEQMRHEIDDLQSAAGNLGDYIDRGGPSEEERVDALEEMQRHNQDTVLCKSKLHNTVEYYREACPEILAVMADAHIAVCSQ